MSPWGDDHAVIVSGPRTTAQSAGDAAERLVADHLRAAGWRVIAHNVHAGRGELDLLAIDPGPPPRLVAVEVRWRRSDGYGSPEETVDRRKRLRLRAALGRLIASGRLPHGAPLPRLAPAIDLIAVEPGPTGEPRIRHIRDILETD